MILLTMIPKNECFLFFQKLTKSCTFLPEIAKKSFFLLKLSEFYFLSIFFARNCKNYHSIAKNCQKVSIWFTFLKFNNYVVTGVTLLFFFFLKKLSTILEWMKYWFFKFLRHFSSIFRRFQMTLLSSEYPFQIFIFEQFSRVFFFEKKNSFFLRFYVLHGIAKTIPFLYLMKISNRIGIILLMLIL